MQNTIAEMVLIFTQNNQMTHRKKYTYLQSTYTDQEDEILFISSHSENVHRFHPLQPPEGRVNIRCSALSGRRRREALCPPSQTQTDRAESTAPS